MPHSLATQGHWPRTSPWLEHRPGARLRRISASNRHLPPARSIKFAISSVVSARRSKTTGGSVTFGPAPGASVGLGEATAQAIASLSAGATATTIGAAASGGSAAGAATAFNADMNNRQLHPTEATLIKDNARRFAQQLYGADQPSAEQELAAQTLLVNTAQNALDNNLDAVVPYSPLADAFLQTLKIEYQQANGTLVLPGTSGQLAGPQQLFYANAEQKNMPSLNQGLADVAITGLIVRTPINPPKVGETVASNRDRLTGLALDAQGRYEVQVSLDGRNYSPKLLISTES